MKLRYKYRIYPTKAQAIELKRNIDACRFVWNKLLEMNMNSYGVTKQFVFQYGMNSHILRLKKNHEWLTTATALSLQVVSMQLNQALKNCFRDKFGFPKFKSKSNIGTVSFPQNVKVEGNKVRIPKIGNIKIKLSRCLPEFTGTTIIHDNNKWYASFVVEIKEKEPIKPTNVVGIDLGLKSFAITSDGEVFDNKKFLDKKLKKLRRYQRKFSRRKKGSNNRNKQRLKVRLLHEKIANSRKDHLHKISNQITNEYDLICLEDLNIKGMMKLRSLSKAIAQQGWATFVNFLRYKSQLKGKQVIQIGRFMASSKTCSSCGQIHQLTLADREINCSCGLSIDRDANAAINIRNWGKQKYTDDRSGINACGVRVRPKKSSSKAGTLKQEFKILKKR